VDCRRSLTNSLPIQPRRQPARPSWSPQGSVTQALWGPRRPTSARFGEAGGNEPRGRTPISHPESRGLASATCSAWSDAAPANSIGQLLPDDGGCGRKKSVPRHPGRKAWPTVIQKVHLRARPAGSAADLVGPPGSPSPPTRAPPEDAEVPATADRLPPMPPGRFPGRPQRGSTCPRPRLAGTASPPAPRQGTLVSPPTTTTARNRGNRGPQRASHRQRVRPPKPPVCGRGFLTGRTLDPGGEKNLHLRVEPDDPGPDRPRSSRPAAARTPGDGPLHLNGGNTTNGSQIVETVRPHHHSRSAPRTPTTRGGQSGALAGGAG